MVSDMEQWYVLQDGGQFYVRPHDDAGVDDVYEYPGSVPDSDFAKAQQARIWFLERIVPDSVKVVWG